MTKRIEKYLEIKNILTMQFAIEHPDDDRRLCEELVELREAMTVKELEELKKYVSAREFNDGIMPLIMTKREQAAVAV